MNKLEDELAKSFLSKRRKEIKNSLNTIIMFSGKGGTGMSYASISILKEQDRRWRESSVARLQGAESQKQSETQCITKQEAKDAVSPGNLPRCPEMSTFSAMMRRRERYLKDLAYRKKRQVAFRDWQKRKATSPSETPCRRGAASRAGFLSRREVRQRLAETRQSRSTGQKARTRPKPRKGCSQQSR